MTSIIAANGRSVYVNGIECCIRPYRSNDIAALQSAANDFMVGRYLYTGFPHPYTIQDAEHWVEHARSDDPQQHFVIEADSAFAGSIALSPREASHAGVGILGYWLAPEYWGRGIATAAVRDIVDLAFTNGYRRLQASVYEPNIGSARVLEKNGFVLEGRLRESRVGRDGVVLDELIFGRLKTDKLV